MDYLLDRSDITSTVPRNFFRSYIIDSRIKRIITLRYLFLFSDRSVCYLNHTILIASVVLLIKSGDLLPDDFEEKCDDVIRDIIETDESISSSQRYHPGEIKKNILRYCRFVLNKLNK